MASGLTGTGRGALIISLVLNAALLFLWRKRVSDTEMLTARWAKVEEVRAEELSVLTGLLVGRVNKEDVRSRLLESTVRDRMFDKQEENGIGAGSMYFTFDAAGNLNDIRTFDSRET